jgi:methyl acetate hydrolase
MFSRQGDGSLKPMDFEMPQRPEFFVGGGALFSTPRNYMAFLQMLLHEGTFNGAQVLKPETVALMRQNHITELWFIVSPLTLCLLSMATCMPIQFSSGRYPIR